jgi:hypothetical protein
MSYQQINLQELDALINFENVQRNVIVLPFCLVETPKEGFKYYVLLKHTITNFLTQFGGSLKNREVLTDFLTSRIMKGTRSQLIIKDFEHSIFYVVTETRNDGNLYINDAYPIISLVYIPSSNPDTMFHLEDLNSIIANYIEDVKFTMRHDPSSEDFSENLVYVNETELFYLANGENYDIVDDETSETFTFKVSDGMLLAKPIIDLYMSKEGDIPLQKLQNGNAGFNHPFESVSFSQISDFFSINMMNLFNNTTDPFFKKNYVNDDPISNPKIDDSNSLIEPQLIENFSETL